jgi:hypothetical protein
VGVLSSYQTGENIRGRGAGIEVQQNTLYGGSGISGPADPCTNYIIKIGLNDYFVTGKKNKSKFLHIPSIQSFHYYIAVLLISYSSPFTNI